MTEETKRGGGAPAGTSVVGPAWYVGWLFTVAFAQLSFWKAVLGLFVWPYFLGVALQ